MSGLPGGLTYGTGTYKDGIAEVEIPANFRAIFERALEAAAPETMAALTAATEQIYEEAVAKWPRGPANDPRYITGNRRQYGHSWTMLTRGVRIEAGGMSVIGYVRNSAPWSWAVAWGIKSFGYRMGRRVARDLIFTPARKLGPQIAEALAKELKRAATKG